jgi:hypothetical protein
MRHQKTAVPEKKPVQSAKTAPKCQQHLPFGQEPQSEVSKGQRQLRGEAMTNGVYPSAELVGMTTGLVAAGTGLAVYLATAILSQDFALAIGFAVLAAVAVAYSYLRMSV